MDDVFLTFVCVVPDSSHSSDTASSCRISVAWSSNCSSAASRTEPRVASFKAPTLEEVAAETGGVQLFLLHVDYYWVHLPHRGHIVSSRKAPFNCTTV